MKKLSFLFLLGASLLLAPACSNAPADQSGDQSVSEGSSDSESSGGVSGISEALSEVENTINQLQEGKEVEVVDFRKLKELLPEKLIGLNRTDHRGERTGALGLKISMAEATYEDGDKNLQVTITDTGGTGMALMGLAAWSSIEVDRESDEGYERTTTIDGYKAFEKFNRQSGDSEIGLVINDRFVLSINARNLQEKDARRVVSAIDLKSLEKMQ